MPGRPGKPFPTYTRLGKLLAQRHLRLHDVALGTRIYHRTITELVAGRKEPTPTQLYALCRYLKITPEKIREAEYPVTPPPLPHYMQ